MHAVALDPADTAERAAALLDEDADLRQRIVSIGLPVLLPDGRSVLRGPEVKVSPPAGASGADPRTVENGWVDLRAGNWERWRGRAAALSEQLRSRPGVDRGSRSDLEYGDESDALRPGRLVAWILRYEEAGERIKR